MNKISIFVFLFVAIKSLICTEESVGLWHTVASSLKEICKEKDQRLKSMLKSKVKDIEKDAKSTVSELQEKALINAEKIQKTLEKDVKDIQAEAEQDIVEFTNDSVNELSQVKRDLAEQVYDVNQNAVSEIVDLIKDAEETALKVGQKSREKIILNKLQKTFEDSQSEAVTFKDFKGSLFLIPVPIYWKKQISKDFYKNSEKLEKIVLDAESSEESTDFLNCFKAQKAWFDKTLSSTNYTSDPGYSQIIRKTEMIDNIVLAVKKAEEYLAEWTDLLELTDVEACKIRLQFLYEVNSQIMRLQDIPVNVKTFTDDQIRVLTLKIAEDVTGRAAKAFPDINFENVTCFNVPKNMQIISQIKEDVSDLRFATNKKHIDSEALSNFFKKLNSDLSDLYVELYEDGRLKKELENAVEALKNDMFKKDVATKKIKSVLLGKAKKVKELMAEISQTKKLLEELKLQNAETNSKIEFIENISEIRLKEQFDIAKKKFSASSSSDNSKKIRQQENLNRQLIENEIIQRNSLK